MPPIGIATLAAIVRNKGHEPKIIDCEALQLTPSKSARMILDANPDYVAFSSTTLGIFAAAKVASLIKDERPELPIFAGGPHVTAVPEKTLDLFPGFDFLAIGEGDNTIVDVLDALEKGNSLENVQGLAIRKDGYVTRTGPALAPRDLDLLPFPAFDLFENLTEIYHAPVFSMYRSPTLSAILTRGCPAECSFCDRGVFGKLNRGNSADYIISMWKHFQEEYGIKDIMIYDDTFTAFRKLLKEMCIKLAAEDLDIHWTCNGRVDYMNHEVIGLMAKAKCSAIAYGIESGSQRLLDYMRKHITIQQVKDVVKWTKDEGIRARGFFIFGYPTETADDIQKTIDLMLEAEFDDVHISLFTPYPNTEAYYQAQASGLLIDDWSKMSQWNPVYKPDGFADGDLERYLKTAVRKFYMRPKIIYSYLSKIKSFSDLTTIARGAKAFTKLQMIKTNGMNGDGQLFRTKTLTKEKANKKSKKKKESAAVL